MEFESYIEPELILGEEPNQPSKVSPGFVLDHPKSYLIRGEAGSGKTALLKHYLSQIDSEKKKHTRGVYIRIRDYLSPSDLLERCILEIKKTAEDHILYLFCDGLDEVRDGNSYLSALTSLINNHANVNIIITSRLSYELDPLDSSIISNLKISPLSEEQIEGFLKRRFERSYRKVYEGLKNSPNIRNSINSPLLLEIFSNVISQYDISVENINSLALIDIFVKQELSGFDSPRSFGGMNHMTMSTRLRFLENLAVHFAVEQKHLITLSELTDKMVDTIDGSYDKNRLINALMNLPLLNITEDGVSFSHRMVFEYFLARSMVRTTGKEAFSISIAPESIRIDLYFSRFKSSELVNSYINNRLRVIGAYDTGTDILYAKAGSLDLSLAIVLVPGIIYCFMKFADSFFKELGKISAQKITKSKDIISIPSFIQDELPDWILENEELKVQYLTELSKKYAENTEIQSLIKADPKKRSKELAMIAVCIALEDKENGIIVSADTNKS
ncbi:hypothetical protein A3195_06420 [Candidatus Thiodiazotropha endoloripes]|uniref:NACHT domain-containing protein n=1 Tax=Candidatus Thiodiazotropha endoloripes TaxID=1818881 RepID=UPI00083CBF6D|nr:NACHT domain-containing protein [Candidatus Thiodiazotropha endoloripes]ODB84578.1 hypothetical protein A3193_17490 [Candidatus Thiodiazotropha endoloripes]ODB91056.1 hypothetical protein A3195_06420 [Candidatus Thiodiazotropha endoloripes]